MGSCYQCGMPPTLSLWSILALACRLLSTSATPSRAELNRSGFPVLNGYLSTEARASSAAATHRCPFSYCFHAQLAAHASCLRLASAWEVTAQQVDLSELAPYPRPDLSADVPSAACRLQLADVPTMLCEAFSPPLLPGKSRSRFLRSNF